MSNIKCPPGYKKSKRSGHHAGCVKKSKRSTRSKRSKSSKKSKSVKSSRKTKRYLALVHYKNKVPSIVSTKEFKIHKKKIGDDGWGDRVGKGFDLPYIHLDIEGKDKSSIVKYLKSKPNFYSIDIGRKRKGEGF
jgi:hypothetical protein